MSYRTQNPKRVRYLLKTRHGHQHCESDLVMLFGYLSIVFEWSEEPGKNRVPKVFTNINPKYLRQTSDWYNVTHIYDWEVTDPRDTNEPSYGVQ